MVKTTCSPPSCGSSDHVPSRWVWQKGPQLLDHLSPHPVSTEPARPTAVSSLTCSKTPQFYRSQNRSLSRVLVPDALQRHSQHWWGHCMGGGKPGGVASVGKLLSWDLGVVLISGDGLSVPRRRERGRGDRGGMSPTTEKVFNTMKLTEI